MWTLSVLAPGGTGVFTVPLRTNSRGEGLWVGNRQVLGAAQFQLPASESARNGSGVGCDALHTVV